MTKDIMLEHDNQFNKINLMRHNILLDQMLPSGEMASTRVVDKPTTRATDVTVVSAAGMQRASGA